MSSCRLNPGYYWLSVHESVHFCEMPACRTWFPPTILVGVKCRRETWRHSGDIINQSAPELDMGPFLLTQINQIREISYVK